MKNDIQNRDDIVLLVNTFYDTVITDSVIGYLFTDVAKVNWSLHLPKMYDFWENILFSTGNFEGNPMIKHKELNQKSKLSEAHFNHWNKLFNATVDALFKGEKADEIKNRAMNISQMMMQKAVD
jgi:hemoglobin